MALSLSSSEILAIQTNVIRKVEEIVAHEDDPAELERLNDGIAYIRERW